MRPTIAVDGTISKRRRKRLPPDEAPLDLRRVLEETAPPSPIGDPWPYKRTRTKRPTQSTMSAKSRAALERTKKAKAAIDASLGITESRRREIEKAPQWIAEMRASHTTNRSKYGSNDERERSEHVGSSEDRDADDSEGEST